MAAGRPFDQLAITINPTESLTVQVVQDYAELGVHRLVLTPPPAYWRMGLTFAEFAEFVLANAPDRVGAAPAVDA